MKSKVLILGAYILGSAIIWGVTIIGCSLRLKGTDCYSEISTILSGGAGIHLILIWVPLAAQLKKFKQNK